MAVNFVLFTFGWELQHGHDEDSKNSKGEGDDDMTQNLLTKENDHGNRGRSWSNHSQGRNVSIDYDSDAHQEGIEKLRCSSTGGFV